MATTQSQEQTISSDVVYNAEDISALVISKFRKQNLRSCCFSGSLLVSYFLDEFNIKHTVIDGYASLEENSFFRHVWIHTMEGGIIDCNWALKDLENRVGIRIIYHISKPTSGEVFIGCTQEEIDATTELEGAIKDMKIDKKNVFLSILEDRKINRIFRSCKKTFFDK